ncbi:MAG: urease accessory protein UreD, partial [Hyphomicrobiales bacterium]|nr:urease accessory protein UreD [Hyphomicrobiales bacterium]
PATIDSHLSAGPGAYVEWLPQETILFDRSAILRRLVVDIAAAASALVAEAVILGRAAHGEQVETGTFRDDWRLYRGGRLVFADSTRLEGDLGRLRRRRAVLAEGTAFATVLCAAPDAAERLGSVRAVLTAAEDDAVDAGASHRDGLLVTRIIAADGAALRRVLTMVLRTLRGGLPLPRVWAC